MDKKVVIIGGGIAGLSAGIYAAQVGLDTHVYERNSVAGGNCSGWRRGEYFIDNCIHWLTGTVPDTFQYKVWEELGVLGPDKKLIARESFYISEHNGKKITLWRDVDRTEKEMLELAPEDEDQIKKFIKYVRFGMSLQLPRPEGFDVRERMNEIYHEIKPIEVIQGMVEYIGLSLKTLSDKFQNPVLKHLFTDFMAPEYEAYWLVMAYSFFAAGNGDLPEGGSMGVVKTLVDKLKECGGHLHLNTDVEKIIINNEKFKLNTVIFNPKDMNISKVKEIMTRNAKGILLANGDVVEADYVISAAGIDFTFNHLLGSKKFMPSRIKSLLKDKKEHHIYSSYQVAFSVDSVMPEVDDTLSFDCNPFDVAHHEINRITVKNYRIYGDYIAPPDKTVIQVSITQYKEDFKYWKKLYDDRERYAMAKRNVADAILARIEAKFPQYENKIEILDTWTPMTYYRRNNCEYGAYMRYLTTVASTKAFLPTNVKGLANVFVAGHNLRYPGGIPTAALTGKVAASKIKIKKEKDN